MKQDRINQLTQPILIAHRGYSAKYPENTIPSFLAAIKAGAIILELDVCLSLDREIIVIHDDDLNRTTDGEGLIRDKTLQELKLLDAGSWFGNAFFGTKIPTLKEVLKEINHKIFINIEIKESAYENKNKNDLIENKIIDLINKFKINNQVIISSFEWGFLERIAQLDNQLLLGILTENQKFDENLYNLAKNINAYSINCDYQSITKDQIKKAHANNLKVMTYTLNNQNQINKLVEMGVDGIFTDNIILSI